MTTATVAAVVVGVGFFAVCVVALGWMRSSYTHRATQAVGATFAVALVLAVLVGLPNVVHRTVALPTCPATTAACKETGP